MNINKYNPISGKFDYYGYDVVYNNIGSVIDNTIGDPSILTPNIGDRYIPLNPSIGVWTGQYPNIGTWDGTQWIYYTPVLNDQVVIESGTNAGKTFYFDGTNWVEIIDPVIAWLLDGNNNTSPRTLGTTTIQPIPFITSNIERMRLDTNGNLLIGTNTSAGNVNLQVIGGARFSNIGTTRSISQSIIREELELRISSTDRFGHTINTAVNVDGALLNRQIRNMSSNLNFTGVFNSNFAYIAHAFSVTHGNTGANTNTGNPQYYANVQAVTNVAGNNTTHGLSSIVSRIATINPAFTGTIVEANALTGEFQAGTSGAITGTFTTMNLFKAQYNPLSVFLPNITNLRAIHIDANFDNITATNRWAILSESTSTSRLNGDLELITRLRLRGLTNFVNLQANTATSPYTFTLPPNAGNPNEVLITDGTGVTSWSNLNSIPEWIAPPLTSTSPGLQGQKAYDATHVHFCVQDNVWVRVPRDLTNY